MFKGTDEKGSGERGEGGMSKRSLLRTLLDLRGSVPVSGEQDFSAIRRQVLAGRARKTAGN
mgnify:CR=1 FL=1